MRPERSDVREVAQPVPGGDFRNRRRPRKIAAAAGCCACPSAEPTPRECAAREASPRSTAATPAADRSIDRAGHRQYVPRPTPIDPSPFLAAENPSPPILSTPSPVPAAGDPPSIKTLTQPPQPFAASHVAPSLLASTLLAASLSSKLPANGDKLEPAADATSDRAAGADEVTNMICRSDCFGTCQQGSDRKHPDRDDGAERGQARDGPAGGIGGFVLMPVVRRLRFVCMALCQSMAVLRTALPCKDNSAASCAGSASAPVSGKATHGWQAASRITDR